CALYYYGTSNGFDYW
nr:immunoglobulin heavy chain junction region [Mus musculus]NSM08459.1 immunoglobulin heavy chain junction region [Mus musculus]